MSGCGLTWYSSKQDAICFEPETDKDLDRLEELLEELNQGGQANRIKESGSVWMVKLSPMKGKNNDT